jgi:hypothetical protein
MNADPSSSLIYDAVNLLSKGEYTLFTVTGAIFFIYHLIAYRALRTRALFLIVIASGLGVLLLITDQTLALGTHPSDGHYWGYWMLRECTLYISDIMGLYGALLLLRDYVRLATAAQKARLESPTGEPPAS